MKIYGVGEKYEGIYPDRYFLKFEDAKKLLNELIEHEHEICKRYNIEFDENVYDIVEIDVK